MSFFFHQYYFITLVISMIVYWSLVPIKYRDLFLTMISMIVLGAMIPKLLILYVAFSLFLFFRCSKSKDDLQSKSEILYLSIFSLFILFLGKYFGELWDLIFSKDLSWAKPIGLSYFIFRFISTYFDAYRGTLDNKSLLKITNYLLFLPSFLAGPLEQIDEFYKKRKNTFNLSDFEMGIRRILIGFFKKIVVVDFILLQFVLPYARSMNESDGNNIYAWLLVSLYFIRAYFDLSGYTDIAIGTAKLFGFQLPENFKFPFYKRNIKDFWQCWHISLSTWCRNTIYFPTFGLTKSQYLSTYATMLFMGLWHHINWNWFMWGIFHASGICFITYTQLLLRKKKGLRKVLQKKSVEVISCAITFLYVSFGYNFVFADNLHDSWLMIKKLLFII